MDRNQKSIEWQHSGGTIIIPDNCFVYSADFDADEPYLIICDKRTGEKEQRVTIPKSLAYFLSFHSCGSQNMHDIIANNATRKVQNAIKDALDL